MPRNDSFTKVSLYILPQLLSIPKAIVMKQVILYEETINTCIREIGGTSSEAKIYIDWMQSNIECYIKYGMSKLQKQEKEDMDDWDKNS